MTTTAEKHAADIARCMGKGLSAAVLGAVLVCGASPAPAWEVSMPPSNAPQMPQDMRQPGAGLSLSPVFDAVPVTERDGVFGEEDVTLHEVDGRNAGFAVSDGNGGVVWVPAPTAPPSGGYMDARELRLKVQELAEQLIANLSVPGGRGSVALPTAFVNQDNFSQTSSLGRFIAEQLFHELSQRGFPVREYRMDSSLRVSEDNGELLLSRDVAAIAARTPGLFFVAGTYYVDREAVFINARLLRGADGMILRTAQLIIPGENMVVRRMLGGGNGRVLASGTLGVRDYTTATQPVNLTPIDLGQDIH